MSRDWPIAKKKLICIGRKRKSPGVASEDGNCKNTNEFTKGVVKNDIRKKTKRGIASLGNLL